MYLRHVARVSRDDMSGSIVGDNDSLVVEFWHPFDEDYGGKDMAAVHLKVARKVVLAVSSLIPAFP